MQIIENNMVKEKLYIEKLENGLTVMILPKKDILKKYIIWGTNYGSVDNKFTIPGENIETVVPDGVAHFLEHKLFEQKDGTNSLDVLSALGINANAYTTNDHTAYLFECTDNFYLGLDEFMNYVQNPYFTDENVEKEKGIIGQEIMMYDDHPFWRVYMNAMDCLYKENAVKLDIAGSIESISKIDKDVLYKCYNTFYNPANMVMVVAGDFVPEEILEEVKKRQSPFNKGNSGDGLGLDEGQIKRIYPDEPEEINMASKEKKMEVSEPLFIIAIKDKSPFRYAPSPFNKGDSGDNLNLCQIQTIETEMVRKHIAIEIILNMLVGKSSKTYKKLYDDGLLLSEPDIDFEFSKSYAHIVISGQSKNPNKIFDEVKKQIKEYKQNGLDKANFERIGKMIYGEYIKGYNDIADIAKMFLSDYFKGINSFSYLDEFKNVTIEYAENLLNTIFEEEKMIISVVK